MTKQNSAKRARLTHSAKQNAGQTNTEPADSRLRHTLIIRINDAQKARLEEMRACNMQFPHHVRRLLSKDAAVSLPEPRGSSQDYRATLSALSRIENMLGLVLRYANRTEAGGEPVSVTALIAGIEDVRALGRSLLDAAQVPSADAP